MLSEYFKPCSSLYVIGSHLLGKSLNECNSALDKHKRIPHEMIHWIFKVSYVTQMLHAHGFHPEDSLRVLVDRSLIKINASSFVRMHDFIQDTGREIVTQESKVEPAWQT